MRCPEIAAGRAKPPCLRSYILSYTISSTNCPDGNDMMAIQRHKGLAEDVYGAIFNKLMSLDITPGSRIRFRNTLASTPQSSVLSLMKRLPDVRPGVATRRASSGFGKLVWPWPGLGSAASVALRKGRPRAWLPFEADANEVSGQEVEAVGDEITEGARGTAHAREDGDLRGPGRHRS